MAIDESDEIEKRVSRLVRVETTQEIAALPADTEAIYVRRLDDEKAALIAKLRTLKILVQDGNSLVTDAGLRMLGDMLSLEELDLEWSGLITDEGLQHLSELGHLRWLDIGFCQHLSELGVSSLQELLPSCEIISEGLMKR